MRVAWPRRGSSDVGRGGGGVAWLAQGSRMLLMAATVTAERGGHSREREEIKGFTPDYFCLIERIPFIFVGRTRLDSTYKQS